MATRDAIARGLALMHEAFPTREITPETGAAWQLIFPDVADDAFLTACVALCREPGRTFFPTPGEITERLKPRRVPYDADAAMRKIREIGGYNPGRGYFMPRIEDVRKHMGDAVANAFGLAGPSRLFSESHTTREIAMRDFAQSLKSEAAAEERGLLQGPTERQQIGGPPGKPRLLR